MITVWFSRMILVDRLTVTVDGSALSGSGLDQRMFSGTSVLASQIWPHADQEVCIATFIRGG